MFVLCLDCLIDLQDRYKEGHIGYGESSEEPSPPGRARLSHAQVQ